MKKFLSIILSIVMLISVLPLSVGAEVSESWSSAVYKQNGSEFSIRAEGFSGADTYTFTATAYNAGGTEIDEKSITATLAGDVLSASIDFEEGGIEADVTIASVETVVTNASEETVIEAKTFTVTPQEVTDNVYNSLTNGFYEPLSDYSSQEYMHWSKSDDLTAHPDGIYNASGQNTTGTTDGLVASGYETPTFAANSSYMGFYSNKLRTATVIDRVVAYYGYTSNAANDVRFYLSNVSPSTGKLADGKSYAYPANFNEEDTANVEYLGYRGDSSSYVSFTDVTGVGGRIVFNTDGNAFSHIVAAYGFNTTGGYIKEMQAYKKVTATKSVSSNRPAQVVYKQNGPVFSVTANGLEGTDGDTYTFLAMSYDSAGTRILRIPADTTLSGGSLTASVNFEEGNSEADVSTASVIVSLLDGDGVAVTENVTFDVTPQEITEDIYNNLTNGFYEPLSDYSSQEYMYWSKSDDLEAHPDGIYNASGQNTTGTTDGIVASGYERPTFAANSSYMGFYSNKLRTATVIDRVVAYYGYTGIAANDVRFYLSNVSPSTGKLADGKSYAYPANFNEEDTDTVEYLGYRGDSSSYVSFTDNSGTGRIVFNTDGNAFSHIVAAYGFNTTGGYIKEMQAYKKVVATQTITLGGDDDGESGEGGEGEGGGNEQPPTPPTPPAGPAIPDGAVNVAENATAFAYGSVSGTAPYMAADGDETTKWMSANSGTDRDYLILDLGAAYMIDALSLNLAEGSGQNFKLYGSNTGLWIEEEGQEPLRTALTATLNDLVAGEDKIINTGIPGERFRYIIVEQAAEATASPFGFNEIGVYTLDAPQNVSTGDDRIVQLSYKKGTPVVIASNRTTTADTVNHLNKLNTAECSPVDANPGTYYSDLNIQWQNADTMATPTEQWGNAVVYIVDLGLAQKLTHVAFQTKTHVSYWDQATDFQIIGTNALPSNDNDFAESGKYDVLASVSGKRVLETVGDAKDTGLQVFDVNAQYQNTAYRYIGMIKKTPSPNSILAGGVMTAIRLAIGTLQAYGNTETLSEVIDSENVKNIIDTEETVIEETELTYSASFWNGSESGSLVAILSQYDENGTVIADPYYIDCGELIAGAYNEISIEKTGLSGATNGHWELVLLNGLKVYDYISDLETLTRPEIYSGSESGNANLNRTGYKVSAYGTVDAGIVGMLVLKPGAEPETFTAEDVYAHVLVVAPANTQDAWDYNLRYALPSNAPGTPEVDSYTVNLISNTGALTNKSLSIPLFEISDVVSDFQSVTDAEAVATVNEHSTFFGSDIVADVNDADDFGACFMLAKAGLTGGTFDESEPLWNDIDTITAAIQAALVIDETLNGTEVAETIAKYGSALPAIFDNPDYNSSEFEEILSSVKANCPTDTAQALANVYNRTIALSLLANGELSDKIKAIEEYSDALGISADTLDTDQETLSIAKKLSKDMNVVKSTYAGGMDTIVAGIIENLDAADAVVDSTVLGNQTGGGSGGGGGGIKVSATENKPQKPVEAPGNVNDNTTSIRQETGFADIDNHAWAHDAIKLMKQRGIINGVSEDNFAPDEFLTRGQTAKLLVLTMNVETTSEDNGYRDCEYGSWYYPFVSAAKAHGLVNGISRTEFGVSNQITRQDLAVMIYRALQNLNMADTVEPMAFTDADAISSYAKEAVAVLGSMGIITGFEDGSFGSDRNATRAQAAVIFARFLNLIETVEKEG